jgi:hypothetical protein
MKHILFAGCSFTAGTGLLKEKDDANLWVNKLASSGDLIYLDKINSACAGNSNEQIFSDTVFNLTKFEVEYAFVQWSSIPRIIIETGLETYSTKHNLCPADTILSHSLIDSTISKKYINKVKNMLFSLMHDNGELLKLVYYVNSLIQLGNRIGTKVFFINGLCPWDKDFFRIMDDVKKPSGYTQYTQMLINNELRDDEESFTIYKKMHNEYNASGGIQPTHWLNLYDSMRSLQIDTGNDDSHPGIKSNEVYATLFYNKFKEKINVFLNTVITPNSADRGCD